MKNLYSPDAHDEIVQRIGHLQRDATPEWGTMNVGQMLAHCSEIIEVFNGTKELEGTPRIAKLLKGLIRREVFADKPFARNVRTHPQYVTKGHYDFDKERERLLAGIAAFVAEDPEEASRREHPLLGTSTADERGRMMYKHLDHHLRQFGLKDEG